jgi:hypothetical protein
VTISPPTRSKPLTLQGTKRTLHAAILGAYRLIPHQSG